MTITTKLEIWPSDAPRPMTWDEAAKWCASLGEGWRLPTKDELNLMYTDLKKKGLGGFGEGWYWSSSQVSGYNAWVQRFSDGDQGYDYNYKDNEYAVRAVRSSVEVQE